VVSLPGAAPPAPIPDPPPVVSVPLVSPLGAGVFVFESEEGGAPSLVGVLASGWLPPHAIEVASAARVVARIVPTWIMDCVRIVLSFFFEMVSVGSGRECKRRAANVSLR
jgi:hypothetical protein